jgi:hypothetical protein
MRVRSFTTALTALAAALAVGELLDAFAIATPVFLGLVIEPERDCLG